MHAGGTEDGKIGLREAEQKSIKENVLWQGKCDNEAHVILDDQRQTAWQYKHTHEYYRSLKSCSVIEGGSEKSSVVATVTRLRTDGCIVTRVGSDA
jgi:hypothetical protein